MEALKRRQAQRARTNEMLNRDRKKDDYLKNVVQEVEKEKSENGQNNPHATNNQNNLNRAVNLNNNNMESSSNLNNFNIAFENGKSPEERATEMLNQFNDYLQKEKENRDKRNF